ncbi:MAG: hypothetical protein AABW80_04955 [Nanoarchaeota archaeon]
MPLVSQKKRDKIAEQILHYLFTISPNSEFTNKIAQESARDEEFTKSLLLDLEKKKLVASIDKNSSGVRYLKRLRWRLSNEAYNVYKKHQSPSSFTEKSVLKEEKAQEKETDQKQPQDLSNIPSYIG